MALPTLLDRLLWTQIVRVLHGTPPEWDPAAASAREIRRVLAEVELDPEEEAVLARWDGAASRAGSSSTGCCRRA